MDFDVISWHEEFIVKEIHVYGERADGTPIDFTHNFGATEEVDIIGVRRLVADINNGTYRL